MNGSKGLVQYRSTTKHLLVFWETRISHHLLDLQRMALGMTGEQEHPFISVQHTKKRMRKNMGMQIVPGGCQVLDMFVPLCEESIDHFLFAAELTRWLDRFRRLS